MANHRIVAVAAALPFFKGQNIKVQTARTVKTQSADGKTRDGFKTEIEPLAERHVLSAKQWADERVTITTIDGRRHEAKGTVEEPAADPAGGDKGKK